MDNLFVFALIFGYFRVPRAYQHRVLFLGVLGGVVYLVVGIDAGVEYTTAWLLEASPTQTPLQAAASRNPITCACRCASRSTASDAITVTANTSHNHSGTSCTA